MRQSSCARLNDDGAAVTVTMTLRLKVKVKVRSKDCEEVKMSSMQMRPQTRPT